MAQTLAPAASAAAASATKTTAPPPAAVPSNLLPPAPPIVDPRSGRVVPAGGGVAAMMTQSGLAQQPWGARPPLAKPPTHKYRARWASVHKIHSLFADGFPELEQRYVRERDAAERVYEYNLGTIEREPGGIDETGALRAAFRALDDACADADDAELADARRTFVEEMRKWSFRGARAPAALAETLSDCDGEDDEGRVVGVRARSPVVTPGEETVAILDEGLVELHRGPRRRRSLRASDKGDGSQRADDYANTHGDDEAVTAPDWGLVLRLLCLVLRNRRVHSSNVVNL